jgi:hypothetical protein
VLYLGDRPADIIEWIESFHRGITGRERMRTLPYWMVRATAWAGDGISAVTGKKFYITTSRLRSMTTDYATPMERTFEVLGEPPYSLESGVEETVGWYRAWREIPDDEHLRGRVAETKQE